MLTLAEQKLFNAIMNPSSVSDAVENQRAKNDVYPAFGARLETAINDKFANDEDLLPLLIAAWRRGSGADRLLEQIAHNIAYELAEADVEAAKAAADLGEHLRGVSTL